MRKYDRMMIFRQLNWCINELKIDNAKRIKAAKNERKLANVKKVDTCIFELEKMLAKTLKYEDEYLKGGKYGSTD